MSSQKSIEALVRLIDDPDEQIFEHVRDQLMTHGSEAIPFLESSWEHEDYGLIFQSRIEDLIHDIQFEIIKDSLKSWINSSEKRLIDGAIIVSQYQYPNLDEQVIHSKIQEIRKDIWLEINPGQTAFEKVKIFNKIFYGKYKFSGNSKEYHLPQNSYIYKVLEMHRGNPLTLSVIYSIVAQSLDMPIYGVNLPNHFVLAYIDEYQTVQNTESNNQHGILFYINAFSKGGIFDQKEIDVFLKGLNKEQNREYYQPCSNSSIIVRMLTNLIASFQQAGNAKKVNELTELRDLFGLTL